MNRFPRDGRTLVLAGLPALLLAIAGSLLAGAVVVGMMFVAVVVLVVIGIRTLLATAIGALGGEVYPRPRRGFGSEKKWPRDGQGTIEMKRKGDGWKAE